MNNPGSILKLWVKAVKVHEADKDPKTLSKKGQEQKTKIKQGLTNLKTQGIADMAAPANVANFVGLRDRVGLVMTRYCRHLKAAKDEDKKVLPRYLKTVTQLTALVLNLDPKNLSHADEDPSLESLESVDVSAVEKALAQPDTGGEVDLDAPAAQDAHPGKDQPGQKQQPQHEEPGKDKPGKDLAATWAARRHEVEPQLLAALKANHPNAGQLRAVFDFALGKSEAGEFAKALQSLDNLAKLLAAPVGANGAHPDVAANLKEWQAACIEIKNDLRKVQSKIAGAQDVNSVQAVVRLESVIKNLGHEPASQQDVKELQTWLEADEVVTRVEAPNPWGIPVMVRERLKPVLDALKAQLPA
jgi:hypothetical protein